MSICVDSPNLREQILPIMSVYRLSHWTRSPSFSFHPTRPTLRTVAGGSYVLWLPDGFCQCTTGPAEEQSRDGRLHQGIYLPPLTITPKPSSLNLLTSQPSLPIHNFSFVGSGNCSPLSSLWASEWYQLHGTFHKELHYPHSLYLYPSTHLRHWELCL